MARRRTTRSRTTKKRASQRLRGDAAAPFLAHVRELRTRLLWVAITVALFAGIGWLIQNQLINWLLAPAGEQQFIYTTVGGGINFVIQLSIYVGLAGAIPVAVYHILRFIEPVMKRRDGKLVLRLTVASALLALVGVAFGYYVGLPAAIHFLSGMLTGNGQIEALLTLNDYLSFVMIYLAGSALIFQLPVILFFINHIKPLKLRGLMKAQRWIILGAFIVAAIITPTPDLTNMLIVALPIILIYQLSIVFIWLYNHHSRIRQIEQLAARDAEERARREQIESVTLHLAEPLRNGTIMDLKPPKKPAPGQAPDA